MRRRLFVVMSYGIPLLVVPLAFAMGKKPAKPTEVTTEAPRVTLEVPQTVESKTEVTSEATQAVNKPEVNLPTESEWELKDKARIKDIQAALKNAGFDPGSIDGVMGRKTKKAVRAFQEANGLEADGIVGPRTWAKLGSFLNSPAESKGSK